MSYAIFCAGSGLLMAVVLYVLAVRPLQQELAAERRRTSELLNRIQAGSLTEFHAVSTIPDWMRTEEQPKGRWLRDPTGLQSVFVPEGD